MNRSLLILTFVPSLLWAQQKAPAWPQYRGPQGDGSTAEKIAKPWSGDNLKAVWKNEVTKGFSSIAVADSIAATLMTREIEGVPTETCVAWEAKSGKELWAFPLKIAKYDGGGDSGGPGDGPRSTPSIAGGKVFVLGGNLDLYALDAKTGKEVWKSDLIEDYKGKNIRWQNAASPILEGKLCIVMAGGKSQSFIAFDQATGKPVWKGEDDAITQATPTVATIHGTRQVIFFTQQGLASLDLRDGKVLWRQPYKYNVSTAASPVVWQDIVYCSAGYGVGAGAFKIKKAGMAMESEELWRTEGKNINHWSTPVCKDGYLYGMFSFKEYGKGPVACVDIRTGETKWKEDGFGPGNLILSGDQLLILSDKGELVLAAADPSGYKELARQDVLDGKCWSTPILVAGHVFARSTDEAACFALPR
jgi:outer membrane protein assembly factor BamB